MTETRLGKFFSNKEKFLNEWYNEENSRKPVRNALSQMVWIEELYDKDFAFFSRNEVLTALSRINTVSGRYLDTLKSNLGKYIDWSIISGLNPVNSNVMDTISTKDIMEIAFDETSLLNMLFSEEELWNLENNINDYVKSVKNEEFQETHKASLFRKVQRFTLNKQDILPLFLAFYGIDNGEELENMKVEHIDEEFNKIEVFKNDGTSRKVEIPKDLITLIKETNEEGTYNNLFKVVELNRTEYVFKNYYRDSSETHEKTNVKIDKQLISQRISNLKRFLDSIGIDKKYTNLSIRNMKKSGMCHKIEQMLSYIPEKEEREKFMMDIALYEEVVETWGIDRETGAYRFRTEYLKIYELKETAKNREQ